MKHWFIIMRQNQKTNHGRKEVHMLRKSPTSAEKSLKVFWMLKAQFCDFLEEGNKNNTYYSGMLINNLKLAVMQKHNGFLHKIFLHDTTCPLTMIKPWPNPSLQSKHGCMVWCLITMTKSNHHLFVEIFTNWLHLLHEAFFTAGIKRHIQVWDKCSNVVGE